MAADENFTLDRNTVSGFRIIYAEVESWGVALGDGGQVTSYGFNLIDGSCISGISPDQLADVVDLSSWPALERGAIAAMSAASATPTERFVLALSDADGKIIAGSEFPGIYDLIGDAFDALPKVAAGNPNAAVFCRPIVEPRISSNVGAMG